MTSHNGTQASKMVENLERLLKAQEVGETLNLGKSLRIDGGRPNPDEARIVIDTAPCAHPCIWCRWPQPMKTYLGEFYVDQEPRQAR